MRITRLTTVEVCTLLAFFLCLVTLCAVQFAPEFARPVTDALMSVQQ